MNEENQKQEVEETKAEETQEKTPIEQKLEQLEAEGKIPKEGEEFPAEPEEEPSEEAKEALAKHEAEKEEKQKKELMAKQKAYSMLQQGAYMMKFIYDDIERQKKQQLNRPQRRRFEKELRKGIFSKELIEVYASKVDQALDWIEKNANNAGQTVNKIATHYKVNGFENPEFLKAILEDYFKGEFILKGQEPKEVDGAEMYKKLKEQEAKGELTEGKVGPEEKTEETKEDDAK